MTEQALSAKLGEINFRKKLVIQHQGKKTYFPNHTNAMEMIDLLRQRATQTAAIFRKLKRQNIILSPFIELGGEKGQRSAVLTSQMNGQGAVLDISADSLASAPFFCQKLGLTKIPVRICADAYHLPLKSHCLPFVFTFQTLHHFPDPRPIVREIYRVLTPGGYFYLDEEPIKQLVNFPFWRRDYHLRWWEKVLKKLLILPFISQIGGPEVRAGVLEETFSLKVWQNTLNTFDIVCAELISFPGGKISKAKKNGPDWLKPKLRIGLLINLLGGGIRALCQKKGKPPANHPQNITSLLVCPDCRYKIHPVGRGYRCRRCGRKFPVKQGVIYLLPKKLSQKLYPNI